MIDFLISVVKSIIWLVIIWLWFASAAILDPSADYAQQTALAVCYGSEVLYG